MAAYDGVIRIDSRIDTTNFNRGVNSMVNSLKPLAVALAAIFSLRAIGRIARMSGEYMRLGMAAQAVGQMHGWAAGEVRAMVSELMDLGIQTDVANKAMINFAREGLDVSLLPSLARGAQDLNTFAEAGATSSDVLDRLLQGVLNLNPLMLRNAGVAVDLNQAYQTYAAEIGKTTAALSIQEKRQAALIAVTEKLAHVTGLYELSQKTAEGQMASSTRIMRELAAAFGIVFQDALFVAVKAFNDLAAAFTRAIRPGGQLWGVIVNIGAALSVVARIIASVFGWLTRLFGGGSAAAKSTEALESFGSAGSAAAKGQEDLAAGIAGAAKEAKGALASFDELNVLQQPDTGGAGGGLPDIGGGGGELFPIDFSEIEDPLEAIRAKADEIMARLAAAFEPVREAVERLKVALGPLKDFVGQALIDFYNHFLVPVGQWVLGEGLPRFIDTIANGLENVDWSNINDSLRNLWDSLAPFAINVGEGLLWLWENVLVPFGTWVLNDAAPVLLDLLATAIDVLNIALDAAKPLLEWLWDEFLEPFAKWAGEKTIELIEWLRQELEKLGKVIQNNEQGFQNLLIVLGSLWVVFKIALGIISLFAITGTVLAAKILLIAFVIGLLIAAVIMLIRNWDDVVAAIQNALKKVEANIRTSLALWLSTFKGWLNTLVENVKTSFNMWLQIFNDWWAKIVQGWNNLRTSFDNVMAGIRRAWESIWNGITSFTRNIVNTIIDLVNGMIRAIVSGINSVIGGMNRLRVTIPDWVPGLGGRTWALNIPTVSAPQIPRLATGAVIPPNAAFAAILGDQRGGRNLEAPESLIRQIVREESGNGGPTEIIIRFEGTLSGLVRELKPYADKENVRIGDSLLAGGIPAP